MTNEKDLQCLELQEDLMKIYKEQEERLARYTMAIKEWSMQKVKVLVADLVAERKRQGLTQQMIAGRTGMQVPNVARFEACRTIPTIPILEKYANALGLSVSYSLSEIKTK